MAAPINASPAYTRFVTASLMLAYAFNSMDRSIISIIGQSMKQDLMLSDTQLGLLGGTAFAFLYALGGIPLGRLAERANRVNILTLAMLLWSSLTALCGVAGSFTQLLLIRMGVGIAESGCSPPAHSLISDYVEPARRASALSVYSCGISLGYILAAVVGGYVTQHLGWRAACFLVGLPGIAIAVVIKAFIREPVRGASDRNFADTGTANAVTAPAPALRKFSLRFEVSELAAVARSLASNRPLLHMVLGVTIGAFAAYGFYAFIPVYYRRVFSLDYSTIGVLIALAGGVAVGIGILSGGFIADRLARHGAGWYALVPALGGLLATPLYALAVLQVGWMSTTALLSLAGLFQYASLGPTFGVVQNSVSSARRATATALLYIFLNVIALGGGPVFTGWAIDRFAQGQFHASEIDGQAAQDSSFKVSCAGGVAAQGASTDAKRACETALAGATRQGLLLMMIFFAWAALHYFLAAAGMRKAARVALQRSTTGAG
jgi:MFS family permease